MLWPHHHHFIGRAIQKRRRCVACRALHHRRLLVHRLDILRHSGDDHRALLERHISGIRPIDAPGFIGAQIAGALIAWLCVLWFFAKEER